MVLVPGALTKEESHEVVEFIFHFFSVEILDADIDKTDNITFDHPLAFMLTTKLSMASVTMLPLSTTRAPCMDLSQKAL